MKNSERTKKSVEQIRAELDRRWSALCADHAPIRDGIWNCSDGPPLSADQGWKLHLSATPLCAVDLFERSIAAIVDAECPFKVASSFENILSLNTGLFGRSQVGKILTVYCADPNKGRCLAEKLHVLTNGIKAPTVPSDRRFRPGSAVFYRYGSYTGETTERDGKNILVYRGPSGDLIPDRRTFATAVPEWLPDPFGEPGHEGVKAHNAASTQKCRYEALSRLRWRGRGGIYLVRDRINSTGTRYVIREGLRHGESDFYGKDGFDKLKAEHRKLRAISKIIPTPPSVDSFEQDGNAYLVLEHIDGKNLAQLIEDDVLHQDDKMNIARQMIDIVASLHGSGWAWRDCKLGNFLYANRKVWAVDFESAMRIGGSKQGFMSTKGYFLECPNEVTGRGARRQDPYALGIALHALFAGVTEKALGEGTALPPMPNDIPPAFRNHIHELQNAVPRKRPSAAATKGIFHGLTSASFAIDAPTSDFDTHS